MAVLGVVLLTGYLGGAISQYVRLEEPYPPLVPLTTAMLAGRDSGCARIAFAHYCRSDERLRSVTDAQAEACALLVRRRALRPYSSPRERCIRSYDFSFSRQNSSTSSVSSSMCWLNLTVNGFV